VCFFYYYCFSKFGDGFDIEVKKWYADLFGIAMWWFFLAVPMAWCGTRVVYSGMKRFGVEIEREVLRCEFLFALPHLSNTNGVMRKWDLLMCYCDSYLHHNQHLSRPFVVQADKR
jgi:hypothetical protein